MKEQYNIIKAFLWTVIVMAVLTACHKKSPEVEVPFERLKTDLQLQSGLLNRKINYAVLLPENYQENAVSYPAVYLLHGFGDNEKAWYQGGRIQFYADTYADSIGPAIFVMPQGFNTYWLDKYNGNYPYLSMLLTELIPEVDALFRTKAEAGHRAVMGYSMGGYGALAMAAKHPDVFQTAVALSMSFRTDEQYKNEPQWVFDEQWATIFGGIGASGEARLTDYFIDHSPLHFFAKPGDPSLSGQRYFIDCGDDEESLTFTSNAVHSLLMDEGVNHEYRVRSGSHDWNYWHASLPEAFSFIRHAFNNQNYSSAGLPFPELLEPADNQVDEYVTADGLQTFKVMKPTAYDIETKNYPLIFILNDSKDISSEDASLNILSQFNKAMAKLRLPSALIIEVPFQLPLNHLAEMEEILSYVKSNYSTHTEGKFAVLVANNAAGEAAFGLFPALNNRFNACLLFNAELSGDISLSDANLAWYLDMNDSHESWKPYETLYTSLRSMEMVYEYRVRGGSPGYASFQSGLDGAMVFIKDNLKE